MPNYFYFFLCLLIFRLANIKGSSVDKKEVNVVASVCVCVCGQLNPDVPNMIRHEFVFSLTLIRKLALVTTEA